MAEDADLRGAAFVMAMLYLFFVSLYRNGLRVGANSPSLWPTISSVTVRGMWCFPLWTRNLSLCIVKQP